MIIEPSYYKDRQIGMCEGLLCVCVFVVCADLKSKQMKTKSSQNEN